MATIVKRPGKNGQQVYRAQVRRKGTPSLSATFTKLSDAKKWVQTIEAAILEGRHGQAIAISHLGPANQGNLHDGTRRLGCRHVRLVGAGHGQCLAGTRMTVGGA